MGGKANGSVPYSPLNGNGTTYLRLFLRVVQSAIPFITFLTVYGLNKVLHIQPLTEDLGCVHIHTINNLEEVILGWHPHKIVASLHNIFFDFLSCIPYLMHYVIPILFPLYLYAKGQYEDIIRFYWLLGWLMWISYIIWLIFPVSPPWVLDNIQAHNATSLSVSMRHREGCAFARLDNLTGLPFFYNMFNGNPIPYASFPSGHVAWPTAILLVGGPGGNWFAIYIVWVTWATLYSCHHYLIDAVAAVGVVWGTKRLLQLLQEKGVCSSDYRCKPHGIACPFHV